MPSRPSSRGSPATRHCKRNREQRATMAKITRINPDGMSKPLANYSHVVTAEAAQKLVFCAGQVAADAVGTVTTLDGFDAQAEKVLGIIERERQSFGVGDGLARTEH